jgi:hypothetical protein
MQVVALDAEVHDPEVLAPRGGQRGLANRLVGRAAAQTAEGSNHAQDDVHRMPRLQLGTHLVRRTGTRPLGLSTGPLAARPPLATRLAPLVGRRCEQRQLLGL